MYGTSSRECASFSWTKNSCLANDLTAPRQANKNLSAREWLVIMSYLYIIVVILLGRSSCSPVVTNRNWGMQSIDYSKNLNLGIWEAGRWDPAASAISWLELSVFRCISFVYLIVGFEKTSASNPAVSHHCSNKCQVKWTNYDTW